MKRLLFLFCILLSACTSTSPTKEVKEDTPIKIEGKYILVEGKSLYPAFEFLGESTVVVDALGLVRFPLGYVRDNDYIRIVSTNGNILLKAHSEDIILGDGFAEGLYIKESLWKQYHKEDTTKTEPKKHVKATQKSKKQMPLSSTKSDMKVAAKQNSPFGNSDPDTNESGFCISTFSLNGRSLSPGGLPRPDNVIQEEGKIEINITVNPQGKVTFAEVGRGTNIANASMHQSALEAARRATFNSISGTNNQSGTITYVYKLK